MSKNMSNGNRKENVPYKAQRQSNVLMTWALMYMFGMLKPIQMEIGGW